MALKVGMGVRVTSTFGGRITAVESDGTITIEDDDGLSGNYTSQEWKQEVEGGHLWLIPNPGDRVLFLDGREYRVAEVDAADFIHMRLLLNNHLHKIPVSSFSLCLAEGDLCMVPDPVVAPTPASTKLRPKPVHIEVLRPHGRKIHNIPQSVLDAAIDRGERAIRRIGREWPYGMISTLERVECDGELHLKWRFEADPETETE